MKNSRISIMAALAISLIAASSSAAQLVPHHSSMVNNEGNAAECVSCHDGTMMNHVRSCTVRCTYRDPHIINTEYPPLDNIEAYRPPEEVLAAGVRLPGGLVTCISCHDLRNPARYHLAVNNQGSRLCLACHIV